MFSLVWTFEKDTAGFVPNQKTTVSREVIDKGHYLVCQSAQTGGLPGIRLKDIVLPVTGNEYCMEVEGFANNNKSFLFIKGEQGKSLLDSNICLPDIVKKTSIKTAVFKINKSQATCESITIGILIGADETATTNDMFFIKKIRIYERKLSLNHTTLDIPQITRLYHNKSEMEETNPKRDDGSSMSIGEYALIRCTTDLNSHGNLFIAYSDATGTVRLRYLCNALETDYIHNILTHVTELLEEDRIIPIYNSPDKAEQDASDTADFYGAKSVTQRVSQLGKGDKVLLYFDNDGYVRWCRSK